MKTKEEKMKLLERLVKEGHITLCEAFDLSETEKEYISIYNIPFQQQLNPDTHWYTYPFYGVPTTVDNQFQGPTTL